MERGLRRTGQRKKQRVKRGKWCARNQFLRARLKRKEDGEGGETKRRKIEKNVDTKRKERVCLEGTDEKAICVGNADLKQSKSTTTGVPLF